MKNSIVVPFDLNTARKIKSGEIEGSVLINNIEIEFVYESKDCAGPYNLLFVRKDEYGISAIYANTEGCALGDTTLELRVEAGAYFKEGDILTSTKGCQFIYDGLITEGAMGSICGMTTYGDIEFDRCTLWTDVYDRDKNRNVRKAIEEEKKFLAEKIIKAEDSRKINIIKRYLSEYEYLLDEMPKHDFKPFERVLVRRTNQERWKLHLFSRGSGTYDEYECLGGVTFSQCIPYEGNEHLLGTKVIIHHFISKMKNDIHLYEASYWVSPIPSTGCSRVRSPDSFTEQNVFDFTHLTFSRWNLISKTSFTQPSCPKQGTE